MSVAVQSRRVKHVTLHSPLPTAQRWDAWPFGIFYSINAFLYLNPSIPYDWLTTYIAGNEWETTILYYLPSDESLAILISCFFPLLMFAHVLTFLSCYWSVAVNCVLRYTKENDVSKASFVKVVPPEHCGRVELCPLVHDHRGVLHFEFQKIKFLCNEQEHETFFHEVEFPTDLTLEKYLQSKGYRTQDDVEEASKTFGANTLDVPLPEFGELMVEHVMSPFFLFQVFCVMLWMLDEYWMYSVSTLMMLFFFEALMVVKRIKSIKMVHGMRVKPFHAHVFRCGKWVQVFTNELLPGDLLSLVPSPNESQTCPADVLLLHGKCVLNEALLTGESMPQLKDSVSALPDQHDVLDLKVKHKCSLISGGTIILQSSNDAASSSSSGCVPPPPDGGAVGYVLKTAFSTSQGSLLRTILFSTERVTVNNSEAFVFIAVLLCFAVAASGYVLLKGLEDESRSRYKLILNCIMILTSVVPPELPIELSLAVNTSLAALMRCKIFCTEAFRVPMAGKVQVCCFDKTGTLTSENFHLSGVAGLGGKEQKEGESKSGLLLPTELPPEALSVIGGCHSLMLLEKKNSVAGDPLEKSALEAVNWTMGKSVCSPKNGNSHLVRVLHRFPFTSALKRMSCIAEVKHQGQEQWLAVVKGAPEVLDSRLSQKPDNYAQIHRYWSRQGCRVLCMAYKPFGRMPESRLKKCPREEVENGLVFAGFLVFQCPMKPDSRHVIHHLKASNHAVVMITGDHTLTACSVAQELGITIRPILVLTCVVDAHSSSASPVLHWVSHDTDRCVQPLLPFRQSDLKAMVKEYDLCLPGDAMEALMHSTGVTPADIDEILNVVRVYSRASPEQKERVLTTYKSLGLTTLMCGDGTNDVGALKQAHCGVALIAGDQELSSSKKPKPKPKPKQFQPSRAPPNETPQQRKARLKKDMNEAMKGMFDGEQEPVRLGDASIASPFTSKIPSIRACVDIIRQGRCTLVTTYQMYQILALNCLISAYSLSVLYLDGVKLGDHQATLAGIFIAAMFLFITNGQPIHKLSPIHPHRSVFTSYMVVSLVGQCVVHLYVLITAVRESKPFTPTDEETLDPEADFKPNVLNTVVYLVSTLQTISTFATNYAGRPYMVSLRENTKLYKGCVVAIAVLFMCANEVIPELNEWLELATLPDASFRNLLMMLMLGDVAATFVWDRLCRFIFRPRLNTRVHLDPTESFEWALKEELPSLEPPAQARAGRPSTAVARQPRRGRADIRG